MDTFSAHKQADAPQRIDPAATAVVVVDMLNDFCTPGGSMVLPGAERLYPPQRQVIAAARAAGLPVIFVVDAHRPQLRRDREFLNREPHCREGTWGAAVVDELVRQDGDLTVFKRRFSAFFETDLDLTLKDLVVDTLVVFGVVTNICVRSTVHDAFFRGYRVFVAEDCCAATGAREQASSLYDIATHFGTVTRSADVVAALTAGTTIVPLPPP